ncbi:hypothetical protein ScPMuIL_006833 [Solemya velum]
MRQQLLTTGKMLSQKSKVRDSAKDNSSNLPLVAKKIFAELTSSSSNVTPQVALLQTMAAMHQKLPTPLLNSRKQQHELDGDHWCGSSQVYNPAAVNPLKYAEQVQKRKLLWSKAKEPKEEKDTQWQSAASFTSDQDGKVTAKFRRLMGIREGILLLPRN